MKAKMLISSAAILVLALTAFSEMFASESPNDAMLSRPAPRYIPTLRDRAYNGITAGDVAEMDVEAKGSALQYAGIVLNGDGVDPNGLHPFLKVQSQSADGNFSHAACYLGNNAGSFGLGFFPLTEPFESAHMRASRSGSTVTIELTHVNEGTLPNQTYVCGGAPAPPGDKIGVGASPAETSEIDNFGDGSKVLDTFSYIGALGWTGNWVDVAPGMHADGSSADGGHFAMSFWTGGAGPCPVRVAVSDVPDGGSILQTVYRFRDEVMRHSDFGKQYADLFYTFAVEGSRTLLNDPALRFRVALMLWRHQSTFNALIQRQSTTVKTEDVKEIDSLIGAFQEKASPALAAVLRTLRQGVRDRSILTQFGVRVSD